MENNFCKNNMCEDRELGEIQLEINELSYAIATLGESISFLGEKIMPIRGTTPKCSGGATGTVNNLPTTEIGNKISVLKDRIKELNETVNTIKSEVRI